MGNKISPTSLAALYPSGKFAGARRVLNKAHYLIEKSHKETDLAVRTLGDTFRAKLQLVSKISKVGQGYKEAKETGYEGNFFQWVVEPPETQSAWQHKAVDNRVMIPGSDTKSPDSKGTTTEAGDYVDDPVADDSSGSKYDENLSVAENRKLHNTRQAEAKLALERFYEEQKSISPIKMSDLKSKELDIEKKVFDTSQLPREERINKLPYDLLKSGKSISAQVAGLSDTGNLLASGFSIEDLNEKKNSLLSQEGDNTEFIKEIDDGIEAVGFINENMDDKNSLRDFLRSQQDLGHY